LYRTVLLDIKVYRKTADYCFERIDVLEYGSGARWFSSHLTLESGFPLHHSLINYQKSSNKFELFFIRPTINFIEE